MALPARRSHSDAHFVVRATMSGRHVDALIDTGATISITTPANAKACGLELHDTEPIDIYLADGSSCAITQYVSSKIVIHDKSLQCKLYIMNLPAGYDVLLGMDWLRLNDAWLQPSNKRLILPDDALPGGLTVGLATPQGTELPVSQQRTKGERRPYGIFALGRAEAHNDVEMVNTREFRRREKLLKCGTLSWDSFTDEESNLKGSHRA